jgi:NTP pyrophosphatase (non-canonical NTP hydrolase)
MKQDPYLQSILKSKSALEAFYNSPEIEIFRYHIESKLIGDLSLYALNKSKNVKKPDFEDLHFSDILGHLIEEVQELVDEFKTESLQYERILSELADVCGMVRGMLSWVMAQKDEKKGE